MPICPEKFQAHCDYVRGLYETELTREFVTWKTEKKKGKGKGQSNHLKLRIKKKTTVRKIWKPMSPTLHKILFHGADIIRLIPRTLMMGQLSEEPLEASNKYAKKWALSHARRNDMENNHKDVFKRFCHLSDPVIHSYLYKDKLKKRNRSTGYPIPVLGMIKSIINN